jgi:hypothetical protein
MVTTQCKDPTITIISEPRLDSHTTDVNQEEQYSQLPKNITVEKLMFLVYINEAQASNLRVETELLEKKKNPVPVSLYPP